MQQSIRRQHAVPGLQGRVEWMITGRPGDGARLVAHLVGEDDARTLPVSARDAVLCDLYSEIFGPHVEASRRCSHCREPYDFDFVLADVVASLSETPKPDFVRGLTEAGDARLESGHVVRAPTLEDEEAVAGLEVAAAERVLLDRCVDATNTDAPLDAETAGAVLEWLSPMVDLDLRGTCPECGTTESLRFSIEHYLVRALVAERRQLVRDTHLIAAAYHWNLNEILDLSRNDRRQLAALVENDRFSARSGVSL
ncbi:hypothetical protein [Nitratireductor sp. XY-223]|uniref:hypothetical protein n=1 Tax=Nitratireductor sp. XY-223 TaxID=2561926 RepID=UPI0010A9F3C2|nr:hypothetical protein [Nitratireductor sp. XY-223]